MNNEYIKNSLFINTKPDFSFQESSDKIKEILSHNNPCMIARFGSYELSCVRNYYEISVNKIEKYTNYITNRANNIDWDQKLLKSMSNNAGFYPCQHDLLKKFAVMMVQDMTEVNILGSWLNDEIYFSKELSNCIKVRLPDLEPYYHKNPWSEVLSDKKVLVIHPFVDSIKKQYSVKESIFSDNRILPDFDLITFKAVQTIGNNGFKSGFNDWFQALNFMKREIEKIDFDIAIIGCGAYGFPLAAHVKRIGKKSVHLGGATQMLFGIIGKRWEEHDLFGINGNKWEEQGFFLNKINENWIRPSSIETPENFLDIENGCYW